MPPVRPPCATEAGPWPRYLATQPRTMPRGAHPYAARRQTTGRVAHGAAGGAPAVIRPTGTLGSGVLVKGPPCSTAPVYPAGLLRTAAAAGPPSHHPPGVVPVGHAGPVPCMGRGKIGCRCGPRGRQRAAVGRAAGHPGGAGHPSSTQSPRTTGREVHGPMRRAGALPARGGRTRRSALPATGGWGRAHHGQATPARCLPGRRGVVRHLRPDGRALPPRRGPRRRRGLSRSRLRCRPRRRAGGWSPLGP